MVKGGYMGKILRVNLTDETYSEEETNAKMAKEYIGGAGFGVKILFDEVPAGADPLGPANKLIFAPGPFTGSKVQCASRMAVTAKSPLTGAVGMGLSGGFFPAELKFTGYDALIIEGAAEEPVYIWINDGKVSFRSAKKMWGTKTSDCQQLIKDELRDQNVRISCIGPAGENICKIACIINERRAVGRKGLGAVMGSKNLKAIAVRGHNEVPVADEASFKEARSFMNQEMKKSEVLYPLFAKNGTPMTLDLTCALGIFPAKNWSATGTFEPVEQLGKASNAEKIIGSESCHNCSVSCSQIKLVREGKYAGTLTEGPEFETLYALGGQTGVDNIDSVIAADRLCDELGLDTISAGVVIGFAMELFERNILSEQDTGGMELKFGNDEAMLKLLNQIAFREKLGDILAEGVRIASEKIGGESSKYALHIKGLELPGYDVRGAKAHGLGYATSYTGADHNRGYAFQEIFGIPVPEKIDRFAIEGKGKLTIWNQDIRTATCDCATMCVFIFDMALPGTATENTAGLMTALTGINVSADEVREVGERVNNLARVFNIREGFARKDDTFPERLIKEPLKNGASKGERISQEDLDQMLDEYYALRDWDIEGVPNRDKLLSLNLNEALEILEKDQIK